MKAKGKIVLKRRRRKPTIREREVQDNKKVSPIAFNTVNAAKYVSLSEAMMRKMRALGEGPSFKKAGAKVLYLRKDLHDWVEKL